MSVKDGATDNETICDGLEEKNYPSPPRTDRIADSVHEITLGQIEYWIFGSPSAAIAGLSVNRASHGGIHVADNDVRRQVRRRTSLPV